MAGVPSCPEPKAVLRRRGGTVRVGDVYRMCSQLREYTVCNLIRCLCMLITRNQPSSRRLRGNSSWVAYDAIEAVSSSTGTALSAGPVGVSLVSTEEAKILHTYRAVLYLFILRKSNG